MSQRLLKLACRPLPNSTYAAAASGARAASLSFCACRAPGRLDLGHLVAEVLGVGRNASIAVNHARIVYQKSASGKGYQISGLVLLRLTGLEFDRR
jgi:hypothetical protein